MTGFTIYNRITLLVRYIILDISNCVTWSPLVLVCITSPLLKTLTGLPRPDIYKVLGSFDFDNLFISVINL
jgi:hypothetical protein